MGGMLAGLVALVVQSPVQEGTPPISLTPVVQEFEVGRLHVRSTKFLAPRSGMNWRFGWDFVLQPVYIVEIEARLPVLRRFVFEVESRPAIASGNVTPISTRLLLKLPRGSRIGIAGVLIGAFTAGMRAAGVLLPVRGPRVVFSMKF